MEQSEYKLFGRIYPRHVSAVGLPQLQELEK